MTTPFKPWERTEFNMNQNSGDTEPVFGGTLGSQIADVPSTSGIISGGARPLVTAPGPNTAPPPLPQRTQQNSNPYNSSYNQPYSRYMNNYSSFGMGGYPYSSYGGYGGYGGYQRRMMGGYGMGYSGFGYQDDYDASMMQMIDESCTTLFGPFESLVRSISSIAMVLDSTHQAMLLSFRTVLSAADSLSKLKNMFLELASSISIIRLIRTIYYKILRFLGLINGKTIKEKEWAELFSKAGTSASSVEGVSMPGKPSPWLAFGFFSLMMGGPYLMFKLFSQHIRNSSPNNSLTVGPDSFEAVAQYDFAPGTPQELSLKRGDRLKVAKFNANQGWALATNGVSTGYVPINRLQILSARPKTQRSYPPFDQRCTYLPQSVEGGSTASALIPPASLPAAPNSQTGEDIPTVVVSNEQTKT